MPEKSLGALLRVGAGLCGWIAKRARAWMDMGIDFILFLRGAGLLRGLNGIGFRSCLLFLCFRCWLLLRQLGWYDPYRSLGYFGRLLFQWVHSVDCGFYVKTDLMYTMACEGNPNRHLIGWCCFMPPYIPGSRIERDGQHIICVKLYLVIWETSYGKDSKAAVTARDSIRWLGGIIYATHSQCYCICWDAKLMNSLCLWVKSNENTQLVLESLIRPHISDVGLGTLSWGHSLRCRYFARVKNGCLWCNKNKSTLLMDFIISPCWVSMISHPPQTSW